MSEFDQTILDHLKDIKQSLVRLEQSKNAPPQEWITKEEAMKLLNCGKTKLFRLVNMELKIEVNGNPGKGKRLRYSRKSINKYLSGQ